MRKQISIEQLSVGMFVWGLDKLDLETAAYRYRLPITDLEQVRMLSRCGVRRVEIETDYGADVVDVDTYAHAGSEPLPEPSPPTVSEGPAQEAALPEPTRPEPVHPEPAVPEAAATETTSFDEELTVAKRVYKDAKDIVQQAMTDLRMGREINTDAVARVVDGMADSVLRNFAALTSLSRLKCFDEYTFFHSVNTSVLALGMGRSLGMDRATLHLLGMGTLLHDVGKTRIPLAILNKPGRFEPNEYEIIKEHALHGAQILSNTPGLQEGAIKPALEHHERVDGTGYPHQRKGHELSQFGLIGSIVDIYDAMTSDRVYHKAMPPFKALQFLYDLGKKGHLDPGLVERFIRCVCVYPVGSCVSLKSGEIGIVAQVYPDQPLQPKLLIVRDCDGGAVTPPETCNLLEYEPGSPRSISLVLDPATIDLNPSDYLDRPEVSLAGC
ncbi:MAG: HD-GYP domain-containing protein [Nitrospirota bacterium]|nr:HD-GYP domain-containing protein [Nitrospirota bacterium]